MKRPRQGRRWVTPILLWIITLCLWLPGLGNLPLRDWDEGRVATVARSTTGLLPMKWERSYLNKPPGLHWPMGQLIRSQGEQESVVRLLPALTSSLAIPLIVLLRRNLGGQGHDRSALLAGVVLMTLLPMARHGRLAMLDGTLVSCSLLLWWGWLGCKTSSGRALAAGLACSGILLLKYWFSVSDTEQEARFQSRIDDPTRRWKLSPMDLEARNRWVDFSQAKDAMFNRTNIPEAPWFTVEADDKRRARLNCLRHVLSKVPWEDMTPPAIELPPRPKQGNYTRPPINEQFFVPNAYPYN